MPATITAHSRIGPAKQSALTRQAAATDGAVYGVQRDAWKEPYAFRVLEFAAADELPELGHQDNGTTMLFLARRPAAVVVLRSPRTIEEYQAKRKRRRAA